jgi:nitrogen fixation/metabolism regulation signal transduction histidine kinase
MSHDVSKVVELQEKVVQMEQEKLENERFAAVGQTVAGLAHGVKNILMGLEGGMYVVNSGLQREDNELVSNGWKMLQTNIAKISSVVKEYLQFARGSEIEVEMSDPAGIAADVYNLYKDLAAQSEITLTVDLQEGIKKAPLDAEGIHDCLANLISNAIDACVVSDKTKKKIDLSCYEKDNVIYYTVKDNVPEGSSTNMAEKSVSNRRFERDRRLRSSSRARNCLE